MQQVWSEYPKSIAMMKVMPGVRLNIANINVAEVKVMPSAYMFINKLPLKYYMTILVFLIKSKDPF
jgi:hypothetical protein